MTDFTIHKCDAAGNITLTYSGDLVAHGEDYVCVCAIYKEATRDLGYVVFKQGDIFTEWFYSNCWYNVFEVVDVDDGRLKGYYCNFTRPAVMSAVSVKADDLELDLFVWPDGTWVLLDEDEYAALALSIQEREQVEAARQQILQLVAQCEQPFHALQCDGEA